MHETLPSPCEQRDPKRDPERDTPRPCSNMIITVPPHGNYHAMSEIAREAERKSERERESALYQRRRRSQIW